MSKPYTVAGLARRVTFPDGQGTNRMEGPVHIYFVTTRHFPFVKVGKSRQVRNRLAQLQNASPFLLEMEASFIVPNDSLEDKVLSKLAPFQVGNEWFLRTKFVSEMIRAFREAKTPEAIEEQIFRYMHEAIPEEMRDIDHPDWTVEDVARWINR